MMDSFVTRLPKPPSQLREQVHGDSPEQERPSKRAKRQGSPDSEGGLCPDHPQDISPSEDLPDNGAAKTKYQIEEHPRITDIESALPPTAEGQEAVEQYETMKSSQASAHDEDDTTETPQPLWVKGRSSIYVDAFNLALDTVLEEESHLFDGKETEVFNQWRELSYEAQYLYVRLFLRKTASWHRHSRLGYHNDISDLEAAIATLQSSRILPASTATPIQSPVHDLELEESRLDETFSFADRSEDHIDSVEEAASLLSLDELKELAKEAKVQGRNKSELIRSLVKMSKQQSGLMSVGLSRHNSRGSVAEDQDNLDAKAKGKDMAKLRREDSNREQHFLTKILAILGPCIRLSPSAFKLFERVHLVFYRSTEWTEKSLTTIILAKIARRHFPEYIVCRTSTIFMSRLHLLEYETAIRLEAEVDAWEFSSPPGDEGLRLMVNIFEKVYPRWKILVEEEQHKEHTVYEMGEGAYLRRFTPGHSYTRIVHKAAPVFGKLKQHLREHELLTELLDQRLFHPARRGGWYQRKALLEEHYMPAWDPNPKFTDPEQQKKHWKKVAVATCEAGLQDPDCHLIFHYDLQKRIVKLEKKLRIPRRLQHDFGHVDLQKPIEHTIKGIQLKKDIIAKGGRQVSTKTIWLDELDTQDECSVEAMCLSQYRSEGWKGYHAEGGIIRTLFAYLFYDILFLYIPNVFQTAYQTCPLDLHTDAFYPSRASEINHRLVEIANGEAPRLIRKVWESEHERRTSVVGLNWDFEIDDLVELAGCFEGSALAAVCKVMAQEYRQRGGGIPDLILWRTNNLPEDSKQVPGRPKGEVMFSEVKSANDRLSDTQRLWIHVLTGAGVKVALCNALAKEVREVD